MRRLLLLLLALGGLTAAPQRLPLLKVDENLARELRAYLASHYATPEDYIVDKFKDHDVVFIGEWHRIKHDPELIQRLIPILYQHGVSTLCIEFARREDQPLIDKLLAAPSYDEALAREIQFRFFVFWGYQEYVDIYKAAWRLDRSLPAGARPFRILALGDSPDWSLIRSETDANNPEIRKRVWRGGGEEFWAKVILDQVVAKGEKALVYSGIHHAFTEYRQPIYDEKTHGVDGYVEDRMGRYVFAKIGKRAVTIFLHAPWAAADGYDKPVVYPVDAAIDAVMKTVPLPQRRVGFDTHGTPFGSLMATTAMYSNGYQHFTLDQFCDGYVYQKPLSEYEGVTPIKDFVNRGNLDRARAQSPNPKARDKGTEWFNRAIARDAEIPRLFAHLE